MIVDNDVFNESAPTFSQLAEAHPDTIKKGYRVMTHVGLAVPWNRDDMEVVQTVVGKINMGCSEEEKLDGLVSQLNDRDPDVRKMARETLNEFAIALAPEIKRRLAEWNVNEELAKNDSQAKIAIERLFEGPTASANDYRLRLFVEDEKLLSDGAYLSGLLGELKVEDQTNVIKHLQTITELNLDTVEAWQAHYSSK